MEDWLSGLRQRIANASSPKGGHKFKSCIFRQCLVAMYRGPNAELDDEFRWHVKPNVEHGDVSRVGLAAAVLKTEGSERGV